MQSLKQTTSTTILLAGKQYKGYTIGNIPKTFAFLFNEDTDQEGITEWFNYKGLTYVTS